MADISQRHHTAVPKGLSWRFEGNIAYAHSEEGQKTAIENITQLVETFNQTQEQAASTTAPETLAALITQYETILILTNHLYKSQQLHVFHKRTDQSEEMLTAASMFRDFVLENTNWFIQTIKQQHHNNPQLFKHPELAPYQDWVSYIEQAKPEGMTGQPMLSILGKVEALKRQGDNITFYSPVSNNPVSEGDIIALEGNDDFNIRTKAATARHEGLKQQAQNIASHFDEIIGLWNELAQNQGHSSVEAMVTAQNHITPAAMEALIKNHNSEPAQQFYQTYQKNHYPRSGNKLTASDFYAPHKAVPLRFGLRDALTDIYQMFAKLSPEMAEEMRTITTEGRLDTRYFPQGKEPCAQVTPVPNSASYVSTHFGDDYADASNLAHELAHGIHFDMTEKQDNHMALYNLPYAMSPPFIEVIALFTERLFFEQQLEKHANDPETQTALREEYIRDRMWYHELTLTYHAFERDLHAHKAQGQTLTAETISDIWVQHLGKLYGSTTDISEMRYLWASPEISSYFTETPYYAQAYPFATRVADMLYTQYQQDPETFSKKFTALLKQGQTMPVEKLLNEHFGLDITSTEFWKKAEKPMAEMITQHAFEYKRPAPALRRRTTISLP